MTVDAKQAASASAYKETFNLGRFLRTNATQLGILVVFFGLWGLFIVLAPQTFLAPQIYLAFMSTIPFFASIAMPLTMLVITGEIDLSFPSIMALGTVLFIFVFNATGSMALALLAGLVTGAAAGLMNGAFVVGLGIILVSFNFGLAAIHHIFLIHFFCHFHHHYL